ncbi:MAG: hypothetical protein ACI8W8_004686, partial [Rhodothermales bacterium]
MRGTSPIYFACTGASLGAWKWNLQMGNTRGLGWHWLGAAR